jgi:hypothetical protein
LFFAGSRLLKAGSFLPEQIRWRLQKKSGQPSTGSSLTVSDRQQSARNRERMVDGRLLPGANCRRFSAGSHLPVPVKGRFVRICRRTAAVSQQLGDRKEQLSDGKDRSRESPGASRDCSER